MKTKIFFIEKAMTFKKARNKSHRLWNEDNIELKQLEAKLKSYQKQINGYK